jgi:periplasmic protein TorT
MLTYTKQSAITKALLSVAALIVVAACGSTSATTGGSGGASQTDLKAYQPGSETKTGVTDSTYPVSKANRKYTIGVAFPWFGDPYWIAEAYGVEQEAKRLNIDVKVVGAKGYGDTSGQLGQLDSFKTQAVDGVIIGAVDSKGIAPEADTLWNAGIPVSYANALAESKRTMGVYTDDNLAGVRQADYIAAHDPNAKVVAFCGPPGVVWPKKRCEAFAQELALKAPNATLLASKYHDMDRAAVATVAGNTFQAFPQANWVYNSTDLQAKGVVDALRARGRKPGDVKITNLTMSTELVDLMKQGWIAYALSERPVLQGQLAVDQLVLVLNGNHEPANWAVDLPGFESAPADLARFASDEQKFNFTPAGFTAG